MTVNCETTCGVEEPRPPLLDGEVVEISLLLPGWQVSILERAGRQRGLTAGAMVRHLLRDYFVQKASGAALARR